MMNPSLQGHNRGRVRHGAHLELQGGLEPPALVPEAGSPTVPKQPLCCAHKLDEGQK